MSEWQPIETAPRDGTSLLLWIPDGAPIIEDSGALHVGWWFSSGKQIDDGWETQTGFIGEATHWMPLPEPPEVTK